MGRLAVLPISKEADRLSSLRDRASVPRPGDLLARLREDSLLRNSVYIMAVTIVTSALGFVFWLAAARRFDPSQVGLSAALVSAMTLVSLVSNLGINTALVQMLPARESGAPWSTTLNVGLLCGLASSLLAGTITVFVLPAVSPRFGILERSIGYPLVFVGGVGLTTLTNLLEYACIAERRAGKTLVQNTVFSVIKVPLLWLPAIVALGAFGVFVSWVIAAVATAVLAAAMLPGIGRGYRLTLNEGRSEFRRLRGYLAGHHSINIGNFAPWWMLPVFVTIEVSSAATAYFYATWRLCGLLSMISPSVASALTAEGAHAPGELWDIAHRTQRTILRVLVPACLLFAVSGHWLLLAFGPAYASEGIVLLLLFTVASVPDSLLDVWVAVLRVEGRLRFGSILQLGTAFVALGLSWILLPPLGISGAGVGWLASRLLGAGLVGYDYRRQSRLRARRGQRPAASGPESLDGPSGSPSPPPMTA